MKSKPQVSVITYHSIDESNSVISTHSELFRAQMRFFLENKFNPVTIKTLRRYLLKCITPPPKTIVLTFDDGFENFYTTAFPILKEYNFPATVFLISDFCGKYNDWENNLPFLKPQKLMGWKQIKELNNYKIDFAAHSKTHPNLTKIPLSQVEYEMIQSKLLIEEKLGTEVNDFSYPYGLSNCAVRNLAKKHFKTAYSTNLDRVKLTDDFFSLSRIDAYYLRNERLFRSFDSTNFGLYLKFRQLMRRLKSACYNRD